MSRKSYHFVAGVPVPQEGVIIRNSLFSSQGPVLTSQLTGGGTVIDQKNTILPVGTIVASSIIPQKTILERRVIETNTGPLIQQQSADNFRYEYKSSSPNAVSAQIDLSIENQNLRKEIEILKEKLRFSEGSGSKEQELLLIERKNFEIELTKLRDILTLRDRELVEWKGRYTSLELKTQEEKGGDSNKYKDLEVRIFLLVSENQKLNMLLKEKLEENDLLRTRIGSLENNVTTSRSFESDVKKYREMIDLRDREIDEWKAKFINVEVLYNDNKQAEYKLRDWERRNLLLQQDNERLQSILKEKIEELERWKKRSNEIDIVSIESRHFEKKAVESEERMTILIKEIEEWKTRYKRLETEFAIGRSDNSKLKDYEAKIALLSQEIERLNKLNVQKNDDLDEWVKKSTRLEKDRDVEVEKKVAYFKEEIYKLNNSLSVKNEELENQQKKLNSKVSDDQYQKVLEEITQLKLTLIKKNSDIGELNSKLLSFKLTGDEKREYEQRIVDLELRISDLHEEIVKLRDKRTEPVARLSLSGYSIGSGGGGLFESERKEYKIANEEKLKANAPEIITTTKITESIISEDITGNLKSQPAFKTISLSKEDAEGTSEEFLRSVLFDPIDKLPKANYTDSGKKVTTYQALYESYSPQRDDPLRQSGGGSGIKNVVTTTVYSVQKDDPFRASVESGSRYTPYGMLASQEGAGSIYDSASKKEYVSEHKVVYQSNDMYSPEKNLYNVVTEKNYSSTTPNRYADMDYLRVEEKKPSKLDQSFTNTSSSDNESVSSDIPDKKKKK